VSDGPAGLADGGGTTDSGGTLMRASPVVNLCFSGPVPSAGKRDPSKVAQVFPMPEDLFV